VLSTSRSREARVKVTLSFSKADHELLLPLLARETERRKEEGRTSWGYSWHPPLTLSGALYRVVMRAARPAAARASPSSSSRASPARRRRPGRR